VGALRRLSPFQLPKGRAIEPALDLCATPLHFV
jgi:hypothetical protein